MTAIAFHFNMPDKLGYACRLLRKAFRQGVPLGVVGEPEQLLELDQALWTFDAVEFIPHAQVGQGVAPSPRHVTAHTRVWLSQRAGDLPHRAVLVNLGSDVPAGFEGFDRVIELVDATAADRQLGRQRWKHYQAAGYTIERHEVGASA